MQTRPIKKNKKTMSSLILGTAQFGLKYGVSNSNKSKPDIGLVQDILNVAVEAGINTLDTAAAYGESEEVLGACNIDSLSIITKFSSLADVEEKDIVSNVKLSVLRSLDRLNTNHLHGVLAHDSRDMVGDRGQRVFAALTELREEGRIGHIGTSVYDPEDMNDISPANTEIIQAPFNILDQRFMSPDSIKKLKKNGSKLHVRSIFLQGLLLMSAEKRPAYFAPWKELFETYDKYVKQSGLNHASFCLGYAASQCNVDSCVVGVTKVEELTELIAAFTLGQKKQINATMLGSSEKSLFDPRQWKI